MKNILFRGAVCAVLLWIVAGLPLVGAVQKFATRQLAMTQINMPQIFSHQIMQHPMIAVYCDGLSSGEGWGMGMNMNSWFRVDFWPNTPLINSGPTIWKDVTVTATIQVTAMSPNTRANFIIAAYNKSNYDEKGKSSTYVSAAGTYTFKSLPFAIEPNMEYEGHCMFLVRVDDPVNVQWIRVKVKSIRFDL